MHSETPKPTTFLRVFVSFRGYVWEPDRNPEDKKDFITFIAQVEGLSAVPDGRIYMNAFIDTIKGQSKGLPYFCHIEYSSKSNSASRGCSGQTNLHERLH